MKVICVSAQLCMGKDVTCDHLVKKLNESKTGKQLWERSSFADSVKKIYEIAFGVNREFVEGWKRNPNPPDGMQRNVRQALQFIGDGFRTIKSDIWIDITLRDESRNICISDGRYINEAKAVREKGGVTVLLYRPQYLNNDPNPSESQLRPILAWAAENLKDGPIELKNLTEKQKESMPESLEFFDYFLVNDQDLSNLYSKIDNFLAPYVSSRFSD